MTAVLDAKTTMTGEQATAVAGALQVAADLFTEIDLPAPLNLDVSEWRPDRPVRIVFYFTADQVDAFRNTFRAIPADGTIDKYQSPGAFTLTYVPRLPWVTHGPAPVEIKLHLSGVCERVEVGQEEYTETVPATDETVKVVKTRPVYETRCPESLLALIGDDA